MEGIRKKWWGWICLPLVSGAQFLYMMASALAIKYSGVNLKTYGQINLFMPFECQMFQ